MKNKDIAYISLRILSICFSMKAINNITLYLSNKISGYARAPLDMHIEICTSILSITSILSYLIVGIVLWIRTEKFVDHIILQDNQSEKIEIENNKKFLLDIQAIAFSIVGIVIVMNSINYIYQVIGSMAMIDKNIGMEGMLNTFKVNLGGRLITLILGLILLLKPRKFMKWIKTV